MNNYENETIKSIKTKSSVSEFSPISIDEFEQFFFGLLSHRWPHLLDLDSPYESYFADSKKRSTK